MSRDAAPRLPPLPPSDWDATVLDALGAFPAGLKFVTSALEIEPDRVPRGQHVLGALALHPPLAKAFLTFNAYVGAAGSLSARDRELAILRISWLRQSEYEFIQHLVLARRAGLDEDELRRIEHGPDAAGWSAADASLLRAVDELHEQSRVRDATWAALSQRLGPHGLLDLLFLVGCYTTLAFALNSIGLAREPQAEPADPGVSERLRASRPMALRS